MADTTMAKSMVLYHYWRSSCSWRVRWALALKGVPYESRPVNILTGEHRAEAYLRTNPSGLLPALVVDGKPYGESLALLEWIEETWKDPPLLPQEPLARLRVRQLALTIVSGTQPLQNPSALKQFVPDDKARPAQARHFIAKGLGIYEELLARGGDGEFSFGDKLTLADLCLVPQVYNAKRFDVDMAAFPRSAAIFERCSKTKECEASAPHNQPGATPPTS